jgi:large-conductance mechanosensitive channel
VRGGVHMGFLAALIQTVIKMIIVGAFAFVGIKLGRYLRKRKDDKEANA